ncbi:hypothetical protein [Mycolicibacterium goodii]|uniref:hypothetical protein n=1 Tax=Mycolicibacterium goodii TaxID=134601 RepID=UPI001BDD3DA2|nr:hypothetical protein [Mycolicibacterium goodii]MBU8832456.1 hypothetical protein [Mycolicibacterium goodii]
MSWDLGYRSPAEIEDERRAAAVAQQRAGMTEFEKQLIAVQGRVVDALDAIGATLGRLQPARPICNQCGAEQPIAGQGQPITFDSRRDRAAEQLAARHPEKPYPFWAAVVSTVLDAMNWLPAAGDGGGECAGPVTPPGPARPSSTA